MLKLEEERLPRWQQRVLQLAYAPEPAGAGLERPAVDERLLRAAYGVCRRVTRQHSRTFHLAAGLLPAGKRRSVHALYAFCRLSDDIVDRPGQERGARLAAWRDQVLSPGRSCATPVALAWRDTMARHGIPRRYPEQLIAAVAQDLVIHRYRSFDELAVYCYGVAATVGLMAMSIVGFRGAEAVPDAVRLGVALQLTNILRDVGEDWRAGRLYLPLDELAAFGLCEDDVAAGRVTERWRRFMGFQIDRARRLYAQSLPAVAMLSRDGRFAIAAAAELYRAILDEIEANDYDVFSRRNRVGDGDKLRRLPGIWWRAVAAGYARPGGEE